MLGLSDAAFTTPQNSCLPSGYKVGQSIAHTAEVLSQCKVTMHKHAGKRNKDAQPKLLQTPEEEQLAKQQFEKLTEAASTLVNSGETDVYTQRKVLNPLLYWTLRLKRCCLLCSAELGCKHVQCGKCAQHGAMRSPHK